MIRFEKVSFGFPQKDLYEDISFEINTGDHAVLIGPNGCGKSSLINLMLNRDEFTYEGRIDFDVDPNRIGYISQFVKHSPEDVTAFDFLAAPFRALLEKSDELCAQMAVDDGSVNTDQLYDDYQKILDAIDTVDAYNYEADILKELAAADLTKLTDQSVNVVSGGEYKLLFIIREMLKKPELLIMDEPDVFLDFENLVGLTKLINSYDGTLLTITHNRLLLARCFDKILDIENLGLREFPGNFAEYNRWFLETRIELFRHARDFDEFIALQEDVVKKIRKHAEQLADPRSGRQLRARATYLERLKKMRGDDPFLALNAHDFHLPDVNATDCLSDAANDEAEVSSEAAETQTSESAEAATPILTLRDYSLEYDKVLIDHLNFEVKAGDKIALVGANGTGKSSLLRDMYAYLEETQPGKVGYFKQIIEADATSKLSGGERNLAQIEEICNSDYPILLLDEPTSHLDIYAQIALEKAIREYRGTVIMVSHDLFAVTSCADRILLLEAKNAADIIDDTDACGTAREMSGRAYRKSIYKNYFSSDIFEAEKQRIDTELRVTALIHAGKYEEAEALLAN